MTEQVHRDHAVAPRGQVFGERPVHFLGEQQPVQQDHRAPATAGELLAVRPRTPPSADSRGPAAELRVGEALPART